MNQRHTTLVVDDEPNVLTSLQALLRKDYDVLTAPSGRAALETLEKHPVNVVLTDQRMPDMTGIELLQRVRDKHPAVVRLLMTAYADLRMLVDAINVGCVYRYIPKPYEPEELQDMLRAACRYYDLHAATPPTSDQVANGREWTELHQIRMVLGSRRALSNVLHMVARHVLNLLHATTCEIYLCNADKSRLVLHAAAHDTLDAGPQVAAYQTDALILQQALAAGDLAGAATLGTLTVPRALQSHRGDHTVCVPLSFHEAREGVMLVRFEPRRDLAPSALVMLETIAAETAAAIIDAHLRQELSEAAHLKRAMVSGADVPHNRIPEKPAAIPNFDLAAVCRPSDGLAGDFFDFLELAPGHLGIAVCAVIDKGVRASLLMAAIRASLRAHAVNVNDVRDVLAKVNWDLCVEAGDGDFASLFYGVLNFATRRFTFSSAGHCPSLLVHAATGTPRELNTDGIVLGVNPNSRYSLDHVLLMPGDVVATYTDGLVEAANPEGEFFGFDRLCRSIASAARQETGADDIAQCVMDDIRNFTRDEPPSDDRTLMIIRAL